MIKSFTLILAIIFLTACQLTSQVDTNKIKQEIIAVEAQFQTMVNQEGMQKAFVYFAAEDAVLKKGKSLFKGKEAIHKRLAKQSSPESMQLFWKPDFVEVAQSGELAYTYGKYQLTKINKDGSQKTSEGAFHTVWKKQENDEWRWVFD